MLQRQRKGLFAFAGFLLIAPSAAVWGRDHTHKNPTPVPYTPNSDQRFIEAMAPHHEMGIRMADMELQKGTRDDVKAIAHKIKDGQAVEIAQMQKAYQTLAGTKDVPPLPPDPHMQMDMKNMMEASGDKVDSLFLENMIAHHAQAINTMHRAMPYLKRDDMRQLAAKSFMTQVHEIEDMHEAMHKTK